MMAAVNILSVRNKPISYQRAGPTPQINVPACSVGKLVHQSAGIDSNVSSLENSRDMAAENKNQSLPAPPEWKRCLDISCIVISLPLILPLMVLIVFWIKLFSRGPALLCQKRIGRDCKPFVLYKFRSMKINSGTDRHVAYVRHLVKSNSPMMKLDLICDSGLITGGCLLRSSGLDELPQLVNVLRGEMSLVGPRPCLPGEYAFFSPKQRERFHALPGLTGMWQVNGKNRSTFLEMNVMDIHYVRNTSVMMDLHIMTRTPAALLSQMFLALQHKFAATRNSAFPDVRSETGQECTPQRHSSLQ